MEPGVSFVLRVRNEEERIENALMSLQQLTFPFEVIVVLHLCTDRTEEIVLSCQKLLGEAKIKIFKYNVQVSRAGLETVVTDADSKHSLPTYYAFAFSHAKYQWRFKYDADFIMTPALAGWMNAWGAKHEGPTIYKICCHIGKNVNLEPYLFNCLHGYQKYIFWEVASFTQGAEWKKVDPACYIQSSEVIKSYWDEIPWFLKDNIPEEDREEASCLKGRYQKLLSLTGEPPKAMARAQSDSYERYYYACQNNQNVLAVYGINLFE